MQLYTCSIRRLPACFCNNNLLPVLFCLFKQYAIQKVGLLFPFYDTDDTIRYDTVNGLLSSSFKRNNFTLAKKNDESQKAKSPRFREHSRLFLHPPSS